MKDKIKSREQIAIIREQLRSEGKTVGYTSGVFDILHPGHVQYLEEANKLVDVLIVGVNSDTSVRANKGESRPINSEVDRAAVVAGLQSVSQAFVFSELNNNLTIEALKPDLYIKAGDYAPEKLSSKALVEKYGGKVAIVPFVEGRSTTSMIQKIAAGFVTKEGEHVVYDRRPAVFVDRDGTINEHIEYLSEPERLREIPGSYLALKKMRELGYRIVVVTNQPGIGLGYFTKEDFFAVNREMLRQATAARCSIDRVYFCPHSKSENCKCRKPSPFLLERAARECNIDLSKSFVIGDMTSDIQLAKNAGCKGILVKTGRGGDDRLYEVAPDALVADLAEAATFISSFGPAVVETVSPVAPASGVSNSAATESLLDMTAPKFATVFGVVLGCLSLIDQRTRDTAGRSPIEVPLAVLRKVVGRGISFVTADGSTGTSLLACARAVKEVALGLPGNLDVVCDSDVRVGLSEVKVVELLLELLENLTGAGMAGDVEKNIRVHISTVLVEKEGKKIDLSSGSYARVSFMNSAMKLGGVAQEEAFNPFLSQKLSVTGKALGATLAAARTVLKQVGGGVAIAQSEQSGLTVSLYLPTKQGIGPVKEK